MKRPMVKRYSLIVLFILIGILFFSSNVLAIDDVVEEDVSLWDKVVSFFDGVLRWVGFVIDGEFGSMRDVSSGSVNGTIYFYYDAENGNVSDNVPLFVDSGPKFCQTECSGLGDKATIQLSGGAPQGNKYWQWQTVQSQNNHYTEISNVGVFPVSLNLGTTYYMAYYMRFDRIDGLDIWHEGGGTQSSDKGVEIYGSGLRWGTGRGQWDECEDSYSPGMGANDDHHFTIMVGNPTYHLDSSIMPMPTNLEGYGCGNTRQYAYETWYSVVLGVKMATDNTGAVSMWVDGEKVLEFLSTPTVNNTMPTLTNIKMGGTIAQSAYDAPPHKRKFDALILTDDWNEIVSRGYLNWSDNSSQLPIRSNPQPIGSLVSGTTEVNISLTTNINATCRYYNISQTNYSDMTNTFLVTGSTTHQTLITNLTSPSDNIYYIRCNSSDGYVNDDDFNISFHVNGTIYFYYDAENITAGDFLPYGPDNIGNNWYQSLIALKSSNATSQNQSWTPQGNNYMHWDILKDQVNSATIFQYKINPSTLIEYSLELNKTYYLAYYNKIQRINGLDVWREGTSIQSANKHVELWGSGFRGLINYGQWGECGLSDSFAANEDHKFTIWVGDHLDLNNGAAPFPGNVNGYNCSNPVQVDYDSWHSVVYAVKISNESNGEFKLWINGENVSNIINVKTVENYAPTIQQINFLATIDQPDYDVDNHTVMFDAIIFTDDWNEIVSRGYLNWSDNSSQLDYPEVELLIPSNSLITNNSNVTFSCNATDDNQIQNITLYIDISGWSSNYMNNSDSLTYTINNVGDGSYIWNCLAYDNASNGDWGNTNYTFTIDTTSPIFTAIDNQTGYDNVNFSYDINASDSGVGLDIFNIDDTTNFSINSSTGVIVNASVLIEYYYVVNVSVNDIVGNLNWSLWSLNVSSVPDTTFPTVTLNSPTANYTTTNTTIIFNCSATDNVQLANITLYLNYSTWHVNETVNISGTSNSTTFTKIFPNGTYLWNCRAEDNSSNSVFATTNYAFSITNLTVTFNSSLWNMTETTNFSNKTTDDLRNLSNVKFRNNYGRIWFIDELSISRSVNLSDKVEIGNNYVFINSSSLPEFNVSANLTLFDLSFSNPRPLRDGVFCSACVEIDYSDGVFVFSVSSFSNYSAGETPTCSDGVQNQDETGVDCGGLCSACGDSSSSGGSSVGVAGVSSRSEFGVDSSLSFDVIEGDSGSFEFVISNTGNVDLDFNVSSDLEFLSFDGFSVLAGEEKVIKGFVNVGEIIAGVYVGKIFVSSGSLSDEILVSVSVLSRGYVFDVSLEIDAEDLFVLSGESVGFVVSLVGIGKVADSVNISYVAMDSEGGVVVSFSEEVFVDGELEFLGEIVLPEDLSAGDYVVYVEVVYDGKRAGASSWVRVESSRLVLFFVEYGSLVAGGLVLLGLVFWFFVWRKIKEKKRGLQSLGNDKIIANQKPKDFF